MSWFLDPRQGAARRHAAAAGWRNSRQRLTQAAKHRQPRPPTDAVDLEGVVQAFAARGVQLVEHTVSEAGDVICGGCATPASPSGMHREWRHRVEGATDPDASATISGLRCPVCGVIGVLTISYGPQANENEAAVLLGLGAPDTDSLDEALAEAGHRQRSWRERLSRSGRSVGTRPNPPGFADVA